ncbi:MAG: T9SS type A sorting domain-containing protein [Crocinitomicaceae bacterium]
MRRIICAFIALFLFVGFKSNAQQLNVDIASETGSIGSVVSIPISIQLPSGSQTIYSCNGSFELTDPSVGQIVGVTSHHAGLGAPIISASKVNFQFGIGGIGGNSGIPSGLFITLDIQITDNGCTDVILTDVSQFNSLQFFTNNGVIFDEIGTDIIVDEGDVCNCGTFISEVHVYESLQSTSFHYSNISGQDPSSPADYTANCIPHADQAQLFIQMSHADVYLAIYLDNNGDGIHETEYLNTYYSSASAIPSLLQPFISSGAGMRIIVSDQPITNSTGIPACGEVEDYVFCDACSCDPSNVDIGPITISQTNPNDCNLHFIQVGAPTGCTAVPGSEIYNFRFIRSDGLVLQPENGINVPFPAVSYSFPYTGDFVVQVTYTFTDDMGCTHTVGPEYQTYSYTGCDCSILPPPLNTHCVYTPGKNFQQLNWNPVQNAVSYEVEMIYNDPSCCSQSNGNVSTIIKTTDKLYLRRHKYHCFKWRVRAVCANGSKSDWSDYKCSCGVIDPNDGSGPIGTGGSKSTQTNSEAISSEELTVTTVPNPANDYVHISMSSSSEISLNEAEVIMHDLSGKVVYQSEISLDETKMVDVSSFTPGVYIIKVVNHDTVLSSEKLIVQ